MSKGENLGNVKVIGSEDDFNDILGKEAKTGKKFIIDFYAEWCGPCKMISPKFVEHSVSYTSLVFLKVNVDEVEEVAAKYDISAMPTFIIVDAKGNKIEDMVGASPEKLQALIEKYK